MSSTRKDLTLGEKLRLYNDFICTGKSTRAYCRENSVSRSTLSKVILTIDKIKEQVESPLVCQTRKRIRNADYADIDDALQQYFTHSCTQKVQLTGRQLRTQAEKLAKDLNHPDWKCSDGWFDRWKKRHNITCRVSDHHHQSNKHSYCR